MLFLRFPTFLFAALIALPLQASKIPQDLNESFEIQCETFGISNSRRDGLTVFLWDNEKQVMKIYGPVIAEDNDVLNVLDIDEEKRTIQKFVDFNTGHKYLKMTFKQQFLGGNSYSDTNIRSFMFGVPKNAEKTSARASRIEVKDGFYWIADDKFLFDCEYKKITR
tara:strand:- start:2012 stop:2509 length:498 start_codon:yes stop_codon:yes gene_type:complete